MTYKKFTRCLLEKYGPNVEAHRKHDQVLWEEATGKMTKGRGYGSSTSSNPCYVLTSIPFTPSTGSSCALHQPNEVQKLTQKIDEIDEQCEKERDEMLKEREEMLKEREEIQEREERLLAQLCDSQREMKEREERLQKEDDDSKALVEGFRKELSEKINNLVKYTPNFPGSN